MSNFQEEIKLAKSLLEMYSPSHVSIKSLEVIEKLQKEIERLNLHVAFLGKQVEKDKDFMNIQSEKIKSLEDGSFIGRSEHFQCAPCQYSEIQEQKIERYEKALEFYATTRNYEPFSEDELARTDAFSLIDLDGGETAKDALGGKGVTQK